MFIPSNRILEDDDLEDDKPLSPPVFIPSNRILEDDDLKDDKSPPVFIPDGGNSNRNLSKKYLKYKQKYLNLNKNGGSIYEKYNPNINYEQKYLKYKQKYLNIKN